MDDYIDVGELLQLSNATALTVSLWFNAASSGNKILLDFKEGTSRVVVQRIGSQIYLYVNTVYGEYTVSTSLDTWYHLAYVFDGTGATDADRLKLYINGTEVTGASFSGTIPTSIGAFVPGFMKCKIGSLYNNFNPSTYNWVGKLDEIAVFLSAKSSSDITSIYNSGTPTTITGATAYWKMGEESNFTDNWLVNNSALSNYSTRSFGNFSTGDYIQFGDIPLTGAFCISAWLNLNTVLNEVILGDSSNLDWLRIDNANNLKIKINGSTTTISNTGAFSSGSWFHLAVVRDSSDVITVYKNGAALSTTATASGTFTPERIAHKTPNPSNYNGFMDEIAIWDSELTSANIITIYNSGEPNDISSLSPLSWWRMGEDASFNGTDFTLPDNGSASNTGISSGMVLNDLTGEAPNYTGGGLSANMTIEDRVGDAPNSTNNALSYNMTESDRETDVPS